MSQNAPRLEFWFSTGSTHSYLTAYRIGAAASEAGVTLSLHPFNMEAVRADAADWPFAENTPRTMHMWRDIARRAALLGLSPRLPAPYPAPHARMADSIAYVMDKRGLGLEWLRSSYREWFEHGLPPGTEAATTNGLQALDVDVEAVLKEANAVSTVLALETASRRARKLGIFGAPSFLVGDEVFWGDDRLEDALAWAKGAWL